MSLKKVLFSLGCCAASLSMHAQEPIPVVERCASRLTPAQYRELRDMAITAVPLDWAGKPTVDITLKVQFHVIRSGGSSTDPISATQIVNALAFLNSKFLGSGIQFASCGPVDYITDASLVSAFDGSEKKVLEVGKHDILTAINIYVHTSMSSMEWAGLSYVPGQASYANLTKYSNTRIHLAKTTSAGAVDYNSTLVHEMGHFFGLFHPNGYDAYGAPQYNHTDELVNGSNSSTTGDLIGDTPADPCISSYVSSSGGTCTYPNNNQNCASTPTFCDANGAVYQPLTDNAMFAGTLFSCFQNLTAGQKDRIYSTYINYYQGKFEGQANLITRDNIYDNGSEPNNILHYPGQIAPDMLLWTGVDIWNCRNSGTCTTHEEPGYLGSAQNVVRIRVRNAGCSTSANTAVLHAYWTLGSTGEDWPTAWTTMNLCNNPAGREIGTGKSIPALTSNQETIVSFQWTAVNPASYPCLTLRNADDGKPMICVLSRIVASWDPMYNEQNGYLKPNLSNNNNIATRNMSLTNVNAGATAPLKPGNGGSVLIKTPLATATAFNVHVRDISETPGQYFTQTGHTLVRLSDNLWSAWAAAGMQASGITIYDAAEHRVEVIATDGYLTNVTLDPSEVYEASFTFFLANPTNTFSDHTFILYQSDPADDRAVVGTACMFGVSINDAPDEEETTERRIEDRGTLPLAKGARTSLFPNPASASVTLSWTMPEAGPATAQVYDLSGRLVKDLFTNSPFKAGEQYFQFRTSDLASGTYFVRLKTGRTVETLKLTLSKEGL